MQSFKFISFSVFEKNRGGSEFTPLLSGQITPPPHDARLNRVNKISHEGSV